jgi:hypothetical protein
MYIYIYIYIQIYIDTYYSGMQAMQWHSSSKIDALMARLELCLDDKKEDRYVCVIIYM